jgi:FkbM family methyltransferase
MIVNLIKLLKPLVEKFPKIALIYRYYRDASDLSKKPESTVLGFRFNGNKSMAAGFFEPIETEIVKKLLPHVSTVVNIGANIGYYTCIALNQKKYVIAFEPVGLNLKYLLRNIKANNWCAFVEVFPIALSNKTGIIDIYGGGTGASLIRGWAGQSDSQRQLVPCSTLNIILGHRFESDKVLFIVDIEGAEKMMLEGASLFLDRFNKPIWMVEISVAEHQPDGVKINPNLLSTFELFWENGYDSITADEFNKEVDRAQIQAILKSGEDTLGTHNFIFVDKSDKASISFFAK